MGHPVTWFQIVSTTPDETAAFYAQLFGWHVRIDNFLGYREFDTGTAEGIRGGVWPAPPKGRDQVQVFVSVPDVAAKVEQARSLGAKVLIPPTTLPDGEEIAFLEDPNGVSFAVWRPCSGPSRRP
jgi:predicted enzyme related to lactoylglutathione lyase